MSDIYREAELRAIRRVLVEYGVTFSSRLVIYRHQVERFHETLAEEILDAVDESRRGAAL